MTYQPIEMKSSNPDDFLKPLKIILNARAALEQLYAFGTKRGDEVSAFAKLMDIYETEIWFALVDLDRLFVDVDEHKTGLIGLDLVGQEAA